MIGIIIVIFGIAAAGLALIFLASAVRSYSSRDIGRGNAEMMLFALFMIVIMLATIGF